ncbi:MAG: hypothetical protein OEL19_04525 [Sulfurimonas sp.]|nr:hypothetical protein [Sulfurimonas sp.]
MKRCNVAIVFIFCLNLFFSGCAQKVSIKALEPAEIDRATLTKKISVAYFEHDRIGLSNKIETKLLEKKIDGKNYFTVISRKDLDDVIAEQKLQSSGLVDVSKAVEVGNLLGAEAIISGSVSKISSNDTYYYENRYRCVDKKCNNVVEYSVGCTKRVIGLSADLRMVDVAKGDIIYADTLSKTAQWSHCSDDSSSLPSADIVAQNFANKMADDFVFKLTPHYGYFQVALLDDPDIKYKAREEKLLKFALEYIEQNRLEKAEELLTELVDATGQKSYVAFYNLGVVKEAQGVYKDAQRYYKRADELAMKPVEEISEAYLRIARLIEKHKKATEQLAK